MANPIQIVGSSHTLQIFGLGMVGISGENAKKFAFTAVFLSLLWLLRLILIWLSDRISGRQQGRSRFWLAIASQRLITAVAG